MVGDSYDDLPAADAEVRAGAGGLVLFGQAAAGSGGTIKAGLAALQRAAAVPLFMSTDEEGGQIERLASVVGALPWPREMASEWSPEQVTTHVAAVAAAMRALGVQMDLAPVLDTASAGDRVDDEALRSFAEDGAKAATYGLAYLRGLEEGGVVGVVKHFPGLGHASADTDLGPATDPPLARLSTRDLVPFRAAFDGGADAVMMSNVTEPDWGSLPASLAPAAYSYLRGMGFTGMVITDSLDAVAVTSTGRDASAAAVVAIEAGADMAMLGTPAEFAPALAGLEAAVRSGKLPMSQVIASVDRIVAVKDAAGAGVHPPG